MSFERVFHYYWPQVKKYKWSFGAVFLFYGLGVFLAYILTPVLYKKIIDLISVSGLEFVEVKELYFFVFLVAAVTIIYNIAFRVGDYTIVHFQSKALREISNDTFNRLLKHSYRFFSNNFSGSLVAKAKRFIAAFETIHDIVSFNLSAALIQLAGVFIVLFITAPGIGFLFLGWVIVYLFTTFVFIRKKIKYDLLEAEADSKVVARLADSITNILNVKVFSGMQSEQKIFQVATADQYLKRKKAWNFGNFQNSFQGISMAILEISILYYTIHLWLQGSITAGTLVLTQFYMIDIFQRLWEVGRSLTRFFKALADAKEMTDIFDQKLDIQDIGHPEPSIISEGYIEFKNVNFEYVSELAVFKNFNLKVKPGEKVGLVGHSGSGKSTIVKMLLRFADVKGGEILIDGQNVARLRQDDLRSKISYVPQEPILFHRPIRENISYSRPGASEEDIISAAKSAHADEFIKNLPQGYDTLVGERGVKLSGGERQRVAIARAMLKNAPILVLDEATSSLDSVSESYIQDAFNELMKGKTTIVIAHRLSTIQKMDRIIVLDKGVIVEEGSHRELLAKGGVYADLWNHQTGGFLE